MEIAPGNPTTRPDRGIDNVMARVSFKWEPTENLVASLKLDYNSQEADILQSHQDIFCGADGLPDPSVLFGGALEAFRASTYFCQLMTVILVTVFLSA